MKTNFKRAFTIVIALIFAIFLISCENKTNRNSSSQKNTKTASTNDIENNNTDIKETKRKVTLYFSDGNVMFLCPETRTIKATDENLCKAVVEEVIKGPENSDLTKTISGDVKVLSAKTEGKICTVDLSEEFSTYNVGGSTRETMAVYSIVSSLCALDEIDKVKININGNSNPEFGGHFSLDEPLTPEESLFTAN